MAKIDWVAQLKVDILTLPEISKIVSMTDEYYVYILWKMYTPEPVPFYVGKGHGQRVIKHGMASEFAVNPYKTRVINKHKKLGLELGYSVFEFYKEEEDALQVEIDLIEQVGRADLKSGPLTNKTNGGDGTRGRLARKGGDSLSARPVIAEGIRFGCLKDAANRFSVTPGAIYSRIKNGWPGYYYEDEEQKEPSKRIIGRYKKEVSINGQRYISVSEASRILGLDVRMICKRIQYGWNSYFYIQEGQKPRKTVWSDRTDKVGVIIRGVEYSTVSEASIKTGEPVSKISKRCLSSNYPEYIRKDGKNIQRAGKAKTPERVSIDGKIFNSISQAAAEFNLTGGGVSYRCRSSNYPDWYFLDSGKEKTLSQFSSKPKVVTIDRVIYASQSAAANALSVDINTLKKRCQSYSFPTWHLEGENKIKTKDGKLGLIKVCINKTVYRSINEASKVLGISRHIIRQRLNSAEYPDYELITI
jgi:hypothetical protein